MWRCGSGYTHYLRVDVRVQRTTFQLQAELVVIEFVKRDLTNFKAFVYDAGFTRLQCIASPRTVRRFQTAEQKNQSQRRFGELENFMARNVRQFNAVDRQYLASSLRLQRRGYCRTDFA